MPEIMTEEQRRELRDLTRAAEHRGPDVSWTLKTAADIGARLGRRYLGDASLLAASSDIAADVRYEPRRLIRQGGREAFGRISGESGRLVIQIDESLSAADQSHVLAHECAHKLLGPGPDEERGCEVFAQAFIDAGRAARFAFFGERPGAQSQKAGGPSSNVGAFDRLVEAEHRKRAQFKSAPGLVRRSSGLAPRPVFMMGGR